MNEDYLPKHIIPPQIFGAALNNSKTSFLGQMSPNKPNQNNRKIISSVNSPSRP